MPELPEVETIRRTLMRLIGLRKITNAAWTYEPILKTDSEKFKTVLIGQTFREFERRGKFLIFQLDTVSLVIHLRMEGKFFIKDPSCPLLKHEHVVFTLDNDSELRYHDTRKFGSMHLIESTCLHEVVRNTPISKLAKEPIDEGFSYKDILTPLQRRSSAIKTALLDQTVISGIGNIYADEICFLSALHPQTPCNRLTMEEIMRLSENSKIVLTKAIDLGGTTIRTYESVDGVHGRFQHELMVHGRKNQPCRICETTVKKIVINGRGTYFCEKCQPLKTIDVEKNMK